MMFFTCRDRSTGQGVARAISLYGIDYVPVGHQSFLYGVFGIDHGVGDVIARLHDVCEGVPLALAETSIAPNVVNDQSLGFEKSRLLFSGTMALSIGLRSSDCVLHERSQGSTSNV